MQIGPMLVCELVRRAHQPWTRWGRVVLTGGMALLLLLGGGMAGTRLQAGRFCFWASVVVASGLAIVVGGLMALDLVARDRREGTLELLFLTPLGTRAILMGKLGGATVAVGELLLALVPMAALGFLLGGVTPAEVAQVPLTVLNLLFVSVAGGLAVSCRVTDPTRLLALGTAGGLVLHALPLWGVHMLLGLHADAAARCLGSVSALLSFPGIHSEWLPGAPASDVWWSLLGSHALAWVLVVGSGLQLHQVGRAAGRVTGARGGRVVRRRTSRMESGDGAVAEWIGGIGRIRWLGPAVGVLLTAVGIGERMVLGRGLVSDEFVVWTAFAFVGLGGWQRLLYGWKVTRFFHEGRTGGGLEMILTTPVGGSDFMARVWREAVGDWLMPVMTQHVALLTLAVFMSEGNPNRAEILWFVLFCNIGTDASQLWMLVHAGAWIGLTSGSLTTGLMRMVLGVVLIPTALSPVCCVGWVVSWAQGFYFRKRMRNPVNELAAGL